MPAADSRHPISYAGFLGLLEPEERARSGRKRPSLPCSVPASGNRTGAHPQAGAPSTQSPLLARPTGAGGIGGHPLRDDTVPLSALREEEPCHA